MAISTETFGGQVTIKTDRSTCGVDGKGSRLCCESVVSDSVVNLKSETMIDDRLFLRENYLRIKT